MSQADASPTTQQLDAIPVLTAAEEGDAAGCDDVSSAEDEVTDDLVASAEGSSEGESSGSGEQPALLQLEQSEGSAGGQATPVLRWDSASEARGRHAADLAAKMTSHDLEEEAPAAAASLGGNIIIAAAGLAGCTAMLGLAAAGMGPALAYTSMKVRWCDIISVFDLLWCPTCRLRVAGLVPTCDQWL